MTKLAMKCLLHDVVEQRMALIFCRLKIVSIEFQGEDNC
jgi:hypothetical protein